MTPARVLVVDDQDSGRFVKVQTLRRAGFTVHEAATGAETLEVVSRTPIDLVVLDVNLPDINGIEVGRRIREQFPDPPLIQILHVSNTAVEDRDRVQGLNAGADAYLAEPVDATVLVATSRALLRVRQAEQSMAEALVREQRARNEAEQANRMKDDFIATLSHELRTPLNALMGWIFQLRQTALSESARARALDSLERNTRVQAQLINDLLDVSRVAKGKLQLQVRIVDMAEVVREATESVAVAARDKGLTLSVTTTPVNVAGDEGRLHQIVANLLNNAIQYTPPGGHITVSVARENGRAVIKVADTGAGIEPALLPHVFEPFRQGSEGLARVHGGLGLGLAVVHQLADLHDGEVRVTSGGADAGSTFALSIPEAALVPGLPVAGSLLLAGIAVIVEAESPDERSALAEILESSGALVAGSTGAEPGGEAHLIVRDRGHDLIVSPGPAAEATVLGKPIRPATLVRAVAALGLPRVRPAERKATT